MLNVFQSNRLEALVTILSKQMSDNAVDSVLTPDTILVQSPGMAQWLKLEIAKSNGIAANLAFPLPSSFIWRLYQKTMPDIPEQSPFNKDRMTWILFKLLPQFLTHKQNLTL
ncbi:exodeoxyribonuclease V subunit gamma [Psychrosphaera algicola]|uniref:Exodeoxyribonuclease V subunit gamma n=1 Tax=Psychrosphaera algicola TaxID=3023714 RepID=A0ABT5F9L1_9GAMM|nr:exodeoxyribonuclease V subunit gamma [Psychrosphaera sp. G1-22]MDC2887824.1 exodeoxyribonuclease V subunit gamma [Psychrosphaera sp. G1-22]